MKSLIIHKLIKNKFNLEQKHNYQNTPNLYISL